MPLIPYFFNQCLDKKRLKRMILWSLKFQGEYKTIQLIEQFKTLGFHYATYAGVSLSIDDLSTPPKKQHEVLETEKVILQSVEAGLQGNRTAIENLQTVIDTWHRTSETVKDHVVDYFEATNILNPVYMMAFSGARGNVSQVRQLVGMRGLMADPKGNIIDFPIRSNFREGLTITEYMISCYGARKGVVDTALRTADAGYLTRRLVDVAQHIVIQQGSCGTLRGIEVQPLIEYGQTLISRRDRLVGRVLAQDVFAGTTCLGKRNEPINENLAVQLSEHAEDTRFDLKTRQIFVRSPLTCELHGGVCQLCYGWSLTQNNLVTIGEAVGVIAGQSIGEPGTQLTMRTFHTGGVFTGEVQKEFRAPHGGIIHYDSEFPGLLVRTPYGQIAFLVKAPGTLSIFDPKTKRQTQLAIPTHMALFLREGESVQNNQILGLPGNQGGRTNERTETRKIVFSEFPGEVTFQNVQMKKISLPIIRPEIEKLTESLLPPKPKKKKTQRQEYLEKTQPGKTYTITHQVGTVWILAGAFIGNTTNLLPIYRTSGQLVNTSTLLRRHAIVQTFEGLVKSQTWIKKVTPKTLLSNLVMQRLIPDSVPREPDKIETQKFLFQPLFDGSSQKIHIYREANMVAFQSENDLFLWPFGLPQKNLTGDQQSTLFTPPNFQTKRTPPYINQWRRDHRNKRQNAYQLTCMYYHNEYRLPTQSGYFLSSPLYTDVKRMHGHYFVVQQSKAISHVPKTVKIPWLVTTQPIVQKVPSFSLTLGCWYQKGLPLKSTENLQGQPQYTMVQKGGFLQTPQKVIDTFKLPAKKQEILGRFQVNPRGTSSFFSSLLKLTTTNLKSMSQKTKHPTRQARQAKQKTKKIAKSRVMIMESKLYADFPFLPQKHMLPEGEFRTGWGYLPNFRDTTQNPEFFGHTVLEDPILLHTETRDIQPPLDQKHTLWEQLQLPSTIQWPMHQWKKQHPLELRALRQKALARHPQYLTRLGKSAQQGLYHLVCQTQVLTFTQNSFAYLLMTPSDQLQAQTVRLATTLSEWSISSLFPSSSRLQSETRMMQNLPKKGRRISQKTRMFGQLRTIPKQGKSRVPIAAQPSPRFTTQYLAVLYRPVHEYAIERLRQTKAKIAAYRSFENCTRNIQRTPLKPQNNKDFSNLHRENLYEAFVPQYQSPVDAPQVFPQNEHVWIKQVASRLVPRGVENQVRIKPLLLPSQTFFTATTRFGCRFLIETNPPTQRAETRVIFEKPWSTAHSHQVGRSCWLLGFGEKPQMDSKYDDFLQPEESLILRGDFPTRRRKYNPEIGETLVPSPEKSGVEKCLVLGMKDVHTYILDTRKLHVCIGDLVRYGDEIAPGIGLPESGQIIEVTPTYFRVRRAQPILFYNAGALHVQPKTWIPRGHPLVTLSYQRLVTGDIVQGIPKVEQFFEGSNSAESEDLPLLLRNTFRTLKKTESITTAFRQSTAMIQQKIIENIQKVYLSQDVNIDDKHFEIIVKQMTSSVKVIDPGMTGLFRNEILPMTRVEKVNAGTMGEKALYEPVIVGISAKAINAESFLSAASFQETTRVLTRDAIAGKTDFLKGLKERVIIGDLIPAGTGLGENILYSDLVSDELVSKNYAGLATLRDSVVD